MIERGSLRSSFSYLSLTGTLSRWPQLLIATLGIYVAYARVHGGSSLDTWLIPLMIIVSIGAATGLILTAQRGELDLLFGSGVTRERLWWLTFLWNVALPIVGVIALVLLSDGNFDAAAPVQSILLRVAGTMLFTCGCCFLIGLGNHRYVPGAIWVIIR